MPTSHPRIIPQSTIDTLAQVGNTDFAAIKSFCDSRLTTYIRPSYEGFDWLDAIEKYGIAYRVGLQKGLPLTNNYAYKALGLATLFAREHQRNSPDGVKFIGVGDGVTTSFSLPFTVLSGNTPVVYSIITSEVTLVNTGSFQKLPTFSAILSVSNTSSGPNAYTEGIDFRYEYRDLSNFQNTTLIRWIGSNKPATGATYYVLLASGAQTQLATNLYTISGTTITFNTAPAAGRAIAIRYLGPNYVPTYQGYGGAYSVTPDGPGYPMRTMSTGLSLGYDLLWDFPPFDSTLKAEFYTILNAEVDWYTSQGYHKNVPLGNYYTRGYLTATLWAVLSSLDENPQSVSKLSLASNLIHVTANKASLDIPGGYGPEGSYTDGSFSDVIKDFVIWQVQQGEDLFALSSPWKTGLVNALLHGTKPNRIHFYDGGDWSTLPAASMFGLATIFCKQLPNDSLTPYVRQYLQDGGQSVPSGTITDYKLTFPLAYSATKGPMYVRSSWTTSAVWVSMSGVGGFIMDHQHRDQGHITIQRGSDYLVKDSGQYGDNGTNPFHNTLLFDDSTSIKKNSTYPPGQGWWGASPISRFQISASHTYGYIDFTTSYKSPTGANSVKSATRALIFFTNGTSSFVVTHDKAHTFNTDVKKIFNVNFGSNPTQLGNIVTSLVGTSKVFMTSVPTSSSPGLVSGKNYTETLVGQANNNFLYVFEATPSSTVSSASVLPVLSSEGTYQGVDIDLTSSRLVCMFSLVNTTLPASLILDYNVASSGTHNHIITDLIPSSQYQVKVTQPVGSPTPTTLLNTLINSNAAGEVEITFTTPDTARVRAVNIPPSTGYSVTTSSSSYSLSAQNIPVTFNAPSGHSQYDWVGVYLVNAIPSAYLGWSYTGSGLSGVINLPTPTSAGTYHIRYMLSNGYTQVVTSSNFTVS